MKLAIMQPYFFPYIGYFQLIHAVDKFMLYENVTFRKKSWLTRNYVMPKDGKLLPIFVPVADKSSFKSIMEMKISSCEKWKSNILKKIFFAYKRAAFFEETMPLLGQLFAAEYANLHEYNSASIIKICSHLGISTTISSDHSSYVEMENELSKSFDLFHNNLVESAENMLDKKTARVITICKIEGASTYCNPINGTTLYKNDDFVKEEIELGFIKKHEFRYKQFNNSFTPNLSIIDVLMHCGKERTKQLLEEYEILFCDRKLINHHVHVGYSSEAFNENDVRFSEGD
jgi:hypothetical protein